MIDESTDIGLNKDMCILARFYDEEKGRVVVKLLDLLPIGADCTADALYKTFKELILSLGIPFNNISGMCSDGANVIVGKCNSFASRLINDIPNVVVVKCICHSAAIIASKACLALPRAPEDLLRQIGSYVSGSSKRCAQLEAVQEMLGGRKKKILRMCATRWLSHHRCVESVLENWEVLLEFFKQAVAQDKLKSTEIISFELNNECNRAYLLFLKYVLNYFNTLNALFQSKVPLIHVFQRESEKLFLSLGQNFIKKSELNTTCAVRSPHISLPIEEVFFGHECIDLLTTIPKAAANKIRMDCLQFYIIALEEIQRRLPLGTGIFAEMEFLSPEIAMGVKGNKNDFTFKNICSRM
ncbi:protein ZBED8-like [Bactrocera dorsalis]|uniref:Protein ZBED8-like n=1 Tax=Bactrocera dorsalis TaxID=27457 RepID=A0ABM3J487_BACDO|nr:protein ZBED8-like [Bactrocera dorsalis]XP_049304044.1 protein ZBED8-like [Bactrocera dorsalis]XP_049304045.1 protein ZBED8-like [Bactrocera dorsalis]XP_049304046.1 protein ZBED8-like [Bactrocera dorsalis]